MSAWDHRKYGTREDPIRQSDLNQLASSYGCPKSFRFRKEQAAEGIEVERETARGATCIGNATHEAFRLYLGDGEASARILAGELPGEEALQHVIDQQLRRAAAKVVVGEDANEEAVQEAIKRGVSIDWGNDDPAKRRTEAVSMVRGALREVGRRAFEIVLVEESFLAPIDCGDKRYWLTGTIDFAYRPRHDPSGLALVDWKSGEQRLSQTILDHGYQFGIYAHALEHGELGESGYTLGQFPTEIWLGHLRDFIPYAKVTEKTVSRPEEAEFFGVEMGTKVAVPPPGGHPPPKLKKDGTPYKERARKHPVVKIEEASRRGPAFYRANRTPLDVARLKHSVRKIVSMVRMGSMVEFIGEHCDRCPFRMTCLTDGYAVDGEEKKRLEDALKGVDLEGLDDDAAA